MRKTLEQLYGIPDWLILGLNAALGAFVMLAHGGALLLVLGGVPAPPEYATLVRRMVPITLPIAGLVVIGSAAAFVNGRARSFVLPVQAGVLALGALLLWVWAAGIVVQGIPAGSFVWTPGLLTAMVAYGVYLACRFILRPRWPLANLIYAPAWAALLALPIDFGVLVRFVVKISGVVPR